MKIIFCFLLGVFFLSCQQGSKKELKTEQSGSKVQVTEVKLQIGGMHCDMCAASIEKGINELEGISYVKATLKDSMAIVGFDKRKVDVLAIEKAIEKRGYTVKGKL